VREQRGLRKYREIGMRWLGGIVKTDYYDYMYRIIIIKFCKVSCSYYFG
jgi:hypothetical protein